MTNFEKRVISVGVSAIKNSKTANKFNHASLICHKGKILSIGLNNQYKTHPKAGILSPDFRYIHSELSVILDFKRSTSIDFSKTICYNIRLLKSGGLGLSYPCASCLKIIKAANFKSFYFSTNLGDFCRLW